MISIIIKSNIKPLITVFNSDDKKVIYIKDLDAIEFILDESCNKLKDIGKISNF